jgi:hypothetical protein
MTIATTESVTPAIAMAGTTGANLIREAAAVMSDAHALAKAVCNTAMVPKHFQGKPDDTAAAMLYGSSLGLDPMQAVRAIYIVHGSPGLYAKSMAGLAAARGHETWTVESTDESVTVAGRRKGSEHVEQSTWTIERATKAGYVPTIDPKTSEYRLNKWGKVDGNEKYLTDPQAMLHAKALAEVCRKIAPDVLAGVYSVEELQSEQRFTVEQVPTRGLAAVLAPQTSGTEGRRESDSQDADDPQVRSSVPESDPITSAQLTKIGILCGELGLTDPAEARREVGAVIGREIKSRKDLRKDEAHRVIERFTSMVEQFILDRADDREAAGL